MSISRSIPSLKHHYSFYKLLKSHPRLKALNFQEWVQVGGCEYQFCSVSHRLILELSDQVKLQDQHANARLRGYHILRYEILVWEEFPEIVVEDILLFLEGYKVASQA
jgi:very-short-patch-repair endonuclease